MKEIIKLQYTVLMLTCCSIKHNISQLVHEDRMVFTDRSFS